MPEIRHHDETAYCSVGDVADLFRKDGAFGSSSNPSDSQVLGLIRDASAEIDDFTRYAFRPNQRRGERKNFGGQYQWSRGRPVHLDKRSVRPLDPAEGDSLAVWTGEWESIIDGAASNTDYMLNREDGILWVQRRHVWRAGPVIKIDYRYGMDAQTETETLDDGEEYEVITRPRSVRRACARLVGATLMRSDQYTQLVPGGDSDISPQAAADNWEDRVFGYNNFPGMLKRWKQDPVEVGGI